MPLPFVVDPRAEAFATHLISQHPRWVPVLASDLAARRPELARAGAWAAVPKAVSAYIGAINATPRSAILAGLDGLLPGVRHFTRRRRPDGSETLGVDREAFKDETIDRIGAHLTGLVLRSLDGPALAALARWMLEKAVAGVLTDSLPPHLAGDSRAAAGLTDQDALIGTFGRLFADPSRGWDARMDGLYPLLPHLLGEGLLRRLRLEGLPLVAMEEALGLRRDREGAEDTQAGLPGA